MADVSITVTELTPGTEGANLKATGSSVTAGQTFEILAKGNVRGLVIYVEEQGSGAATIVFDAGAYPPSALQGQGSDSVVLATSDLKPYIPIAGRHIQSTGKITGSVATNTVKIRAYRNPSGY